MTDKTLNIETAAKQLDRVLGFFTRVESKSSFLFAVDTTMLGALALNIQRADLFSGLHMTFAAISAALLAASLMFIYRCTFPNLDGGHSSLIYFREIAKRRETEFVEAFRSVSEQSLLDDLSSQVWRNSAILSAKFFALKIAFIATALAILPWSVFLVVASITHSQFPVIK